MNAIKYFLTWLAEKITGRKCSRCRHNIKGRCCHPNGCMYLQCWPSITRPGFEEQPAQTVQVGALTTEEQHQLQKIQGALADAETAAREGGLLED